MMAVDDKDIKQKRRKDKKRKKSDDFTMTNELTHCKKENNKSKKFAVDDNVKKIKTKKRSSEIDIGEVEPSAKTKKSEDLDQQLSKEAHRKMKKRKDKFKDKVPDFLRLLQTKPPKVEEEPKVVAKTAEEIEIEKMKAEKRERMREKRIAKKKNKGKKIESTVAKDAALQYLTLWNTSREVWRFQKVRQVWLLGHMYDTDLISDAIFEVLLKYLEDLKGHSKVKTIEEAEKILATAEEEEDNETSEESEEEGEEDEETEGEEKEETKGEEKTSKKQKSGEKSSKKKDVTSSEKYQRAREILQILT